MDGLRSEKNSARGLKKVPRLSPRPLRAHDEFVQIFSVLGVYGEAGADVCVDKGIVGDRQRIFKIGLIAVFGRNRGHL